MKRLDVVGGEGGKLGLEVETPTTSGLPREETDEEIAFRCGNEAAKRYFKIGRAITIEDACIQAARDALRFRIKIRR